MSNYGSFSKIGRKNHYLEILKSKIRRKNHYLEFLKSKIGRKTYYLEKLYSKNGRKFYYSQKLWFDNFFAWKEYNFLSGFLTNTILNFAQECVLFWPLIILQKWKGRVESLQTKEFLRCNKDHKLFKFSFI